MNLYALIRGGVIVELIESDLPLKQLFHPDLDWRDVTGVQVDGRTLHLGDVVAGGGWAPPPPPLVRHRTDYSPLEIMGRLTDAERGRIFSAARATDALFGFTIQLAAARFIDVGDPSTRAGFSSLVSAGLLTQARMDEVLGGADTPPAAPADAPPAATPGEAAPDATADPPPTAPADPPPAAAPGEAAPGATAGVVAPA